MNFQQIVILVATIILILMLIIISYSLAKHRNNQTFPPASSECPDFWVSTDKGCENPKNLGKCGKVHLTLVNIDTKVTTVTVIKQGGQEIVK